MKQIFISEEDMIKPYGDSANLFYTMGQIVDPCTIHSLEQHDAEVEKSVAKDILKYLYNLQQQYNVDCEHITSQELVEIARTKYGVEVDE